MGLGVLAPANFRDPPPCNTVAHVAPLGWEHIALTRDYVWTNSNAAPDFRPLRDVPTAFLARGGLAYDFVQIVWRPPICYCGPPPCPAQGVFTEVVKGLTEVGKEDRQPPRQYTYPSQWLPRNSGSRRRIAVTDITNIPI